MNGLGALENSHTRNMCSLIVESFHSENITAEPGDHMQETTEKSAETFASFDLLIAVLAFTSIRFRVSSFFAARVDAAAAAK